MKKYILISVLGLLFVTHTVAQDKINSEEFDASFAHTVYFWLKNPDNEDDRIQFEDSLKRFLNHSKFAKTNFIGIPPKSTREVVDDSFTYALIVTFDSAESQDGYQKEAAHLQFIDECKDLWSKVIVYDSKGIQ
ncbi:MAG: Dabb family protein [Bacteroidota bacterium]